MGRIQLHTELGKTLKHEKQEEPYMCSPTPGSSHYIQGRKTVDISKAVRLAGVLAYSCVPSAQQAEAGRFAACPGFNNSRLAGAKVGDAVLVRYLSADTS